MELFVRNASLLIRNEKSSGDAPVKMEDKYMNKTWFNGKGRFMVIGAALLVAVMLTAVLFNITGSSNSTFASEDTQEAKRTLNVNGQGTINAAPDIAYINMGVLTEAKTAKQAQQQNAASMADIIALIKAAGVKNDDIKTVNYSIYPKYDYNKDTGESKIVGYTVNNSVMVTVRDIDKTGQLIDIASNSGMNVTGNISFGLSDPDKYYNQALKAAVESARGKAEIMASTLGITLKLPLSINESGSYNPPVIYGAGAYDMKLAAEEARTPIQGGSLEVRAQVTISYEY